MPEPGTIPVDLTCAECRRSPRAGTSVIQIEATCAHLFGEHLERSRSALEAFDARNSEAHGQGLDTAH